MLQNLTDWLGDNPWALWLTMAVLLGVAEIASLDFVLIMIALGALAAAGVAVLAPDLWWLQILIASGVSVGLLFLARPTIMERIHRMPGYRSSTDKIVGSSGVATMEVTADSGEVKIDGLIWTARVHTPESVIAEGTEIEVFEIEGAIAIVYPKYGELPGGSQGIAGPEAT